MAHPFMAAVADGLAERGIATLRYQFPVHGARLEAAGCADARAGGRARRGRGAAQRLPELPLFAGGKSFGGRMTSQAQAESPLPASAASSSSGFRCIRPGKPSDERATHLPT